MSFIFHTSDGLPDAVAMVLAQHPDRTIVIINYALVELMSPSERLELLNALLAKTEGRPPAGRGLDELAAPRRERSRRIDENNRYNELSTSEQTDSRA
jgi:hypothetical protein